MIKIQDIADKAGVSKSAVSLALNGKSGISDDTRQKILQIAKENNYKPLRKLKKKAKTKQFFIRILSCNDVNRFTYNFQNLPHFDELIADFSTIAREFPITLMINSISINNVEMEFKNIEKIQPSDAIILLGTDLPETIVQKINELHPNVIIIDTCFYQLNNNFISINNYQGAYQATEYLLKNGHRHIGYVKARQRIRNFKERHRGFNDALRHYNINPEKSGPVVILSVNDITPHPNYLQNKKLPTAFFCENDSLAISLIKSLQCLNIKVPEDVSVIGFDNIAESNVITPELTTIDVNRRYMVKTALKEAIEIIQKGKIDQTQILINTNIVERKSVRILK